MIAMIIVGVLLAVASYFGWSYIHEMSHILMAKKRVGVEKYELKIFPHVHPVSGFRWAACKYWYSKEPTDEDSAWISIAPRFPDALAAIMFVLAGFMSGWLALVWAIFWGAGLVDLFTGSLGISKYSDLQKAAKGFKKAPIMFRLIGFVTIAASVVSAALLYFGG